MGDFFGREELLEDVRRMLVRQNRTSTVTIQGLCGIGKTKLAVEYAYRYASEYDLVWWVPCDDLESAHAAMIGLESRLGLANVPRKPREDRYVEVFEQLRKAQTHPRWLLIFDNANESADIRELIPPRNGHALITSRYYRWGATEDVLEMDVFPPEESVNFLRQRVRGFSEPQAHQLAAALGHLPLALEHAVESRIPVPEYLSRLENDPLGLLASQPSDYPATITATWGAIIDDLNSSAAYSLDLLHCLAFFGSGTIRRELLEKGRLNQDISIHELLRDTMQCNRAISALRRVGLLRVDPATDTLRIHRLTQSIVRANVARSPSDDTGRRELDVHLLLANDDPGDPEDPDAWRRYEELHASIGTAGMTDCKADLVRRLIINLVRYLHASGDPRAAVNLADTALDRWSANGGAADPEACAGYLDMLEAKADALVSAGLLTAARRVQQDALAVMRANPARWPRQIVTLSRVDGAGLRRDGKFREALEADTDAKDRHIATFGPDHPQTFIAINNLVVDYALDGNYPASVAEAERAYSDTLAYGNVEGLPVLFQKNLLARCKQLAGQPGEALVMLTEVHVGYFAMVEHDLLSEDHPLLLAHEIDFAVTRQDLDVGMPELAKLAESMHDVHVRCWRALDVDHPQTLAASVARGSIIRRLPGQAAEAARVVADAERCYRATLGDHPYTHACAAFLASIRRQAGSPVRAVSELRSSLDRLRALVGGLHPYTLAVCVALMNALADAGEPEAALTEGQTAFTGFQESLGPDHPHTLACAANVVAVLSLLNQEREAAELRGQTSARYRGTVGDGHYHARLFAEGTRFDLDFAPVPLLRRH
jgi:CTP:molybdopterin cytidylyltransferase MocA